MTRGKLSIIACESGRPFADKIIEKLKDKGEDIEIINSNETHFADTEI